MLFLSCIVLTSQAFSQKDLALWYSKPAQVWTEALPVGNGRLGGMVFGGVTEELIQLNEATLWSGGPVKKNVNPASKDYLKPLRDALFASDYKKADELAHQMQGLYSESYLPLGDLVLKQTFANKEVSNYYRDLDIQDAVSTTKYTVDGVNYRREVFVSAPDNIMVVKITADKAGSINLQLSVKSQLKYQLQANNNTIVLKGKAPAHVEPSYYNPKRELVVYDDTTGCRGMRFELLVKAVATGGTSVGDTNGIRISNASEVMLYLAAATSFNGYDVCPDKNGKDEHRLAASYLEKASRKSYALLLKDHLADFHKYFNRVSLQLGSSKESRSQVPTDERLEMYRGSGNDHGLEALYFQYGRYLLISSSRTPSVPANLQGIWNKQLRAPWSSNYTTNINVQMNYWPAESTNLSELHRPLFGLIKELSVTGKQTAKEFYGINKGWVVNHNSDIWALSNPVGVPGRAIRNGPTGQWVETG
nr:glycoside hydrolase family 95 protein [Sediminibacterium roseum]